MEYEDGFDGGCLGMCDQDMRRCMNIRTQFLTTIDHGNHEIWKTIFKTLRERNEALQSQLRELIHC